MKIKWFRDTDNSNERFSDHKRTKSERREKHLTKNKRLHQYHNLRNLFEDEE
jgi:hypothetical protein